MLTTLKEHPDAWTRVDTILEFSNNQQTKYYALQILEQVIKTRWKVLPRNQCEGKECFLSFGYWLIVHYSKNLLVWNAYVGILFLEESRENIFTGNSRCNIHNLNFLHSNCLRHSDKGRVWKNLWSKVQLSFSFKFATIFFLLAVLHSVDERKLNQGQCA